jgi:hypothetical protein
MEQIAIRGRRAVGFGLSDAAPSTAVTPSNRAVGFFLGSGAMALASLGLSTLLGGDKNTHWPYISLATLGGGVAGAVWAPGAAQAAAQPAGGPVSLTVSDVPVIQGVSAAAGTAVTFNLPAGATWKTVSVGTPGNEFMGNLTQVGMTTPVVVPVPPVTGATVNATWATADGQTHFQATMFLPPGATLSTPLTDKAAVTTVQHVINSIPVPQRQAMGMQQSVPENGDATDPVFVQQLAAAQKFLVAESAKMGHPFQLRTDGVLDYATYAIFSVPF